MPARSLAKVLPTALVAATILAGCPGAVTGAGRGAGGQTSLAANAGSAAASAAARTPQGRACAEAPLLEPQVAVRGSTQRNEDLFHASCAYGAASPDAVYRFRLAAPAHVVVRLQGGYDTVLHLRAACLDDDTEIACNDDSPGSVRRSSVEATLPAGDYYVFVDGYRSGNAGFYSLTYNATPTSVTAPTTPALARTRAGEGATVEHVPGQSGGVTGVVTFAKRQFTPRGLTRVTTDTIAPHFAVEAVNTEGAVVATGVTDEQGRFALNVPRGATVRVRALSRTALLGNDIRVVSDPGTERPYEVSTTPFRVEGDERVGLHAGIGGVEPAGAFNILAQFVKYVPAATRAFGRPLPTLYAFWQRGNNMTLPQGSITAFLMDYHRHQGTYALQIQGGNPGNEDGSDSDQFDDPVIVHEFSHFVIHTMAGRYSVGGQHHNGELHFPGQALDEGAATALGCAVSGNSHYWDTAGLEPTAQILVDEDVESMPLPDRGIGSQNSAQALVWDLIDGAEGIPDRDNDGVAIGVAGVLRIYSSFRDDPVAFPGVHTVLERAVSLGLITPTQAARLVRTPQDHGFNFPLAPSDQWPIQLTLPAEVTGLVDGLSQPAPSGGRNSPPNGFDAIRTYRFTLTRRGMVYLDLTIQGAGTNASGTDLDLQLFTRNLAPIAQSGTQRAQESIRQILDPGTYIVFVRDADFTPARVAVRPVGNRANYTLSVRQSSEFH